jgi:hypothetical protein
VKPHQVRGFSDTEEPELLQFSLCAAVVQTLDVDEELRQQIQEALPNDKEIGQYLEQLRDRTLPREDDVKEFLVPFSLLEDLVLRDGLV